MIYGLHNCLFICVALCNRMRRLCSALNAIIDSGYRGTLNEAKMAFELFQLVPGSST